MLNTEDKNFVSNGSAEAELHTPPNSFSDSFALFVTKALRFLADTLFRKRYGHRAVVLETVAGVPGMVAGVIHHLRSLRNMKDDNGMIKENIWRITKKFIEEKKELQYILPHFLKYR